MNLYKITIIFLIFQWLPVATTAKDEIKPWSSIEKKAAIFGCHQGFLRTVTNDFMKRRNLSRDELPEGFNEKITLTLKPYLEVCDCVIEKISTEWPIEYFVAHQDDELPGKFKQIIESGECTINTKDREKFRSVLRKEEADIEPSNKVDCNETTGSCRLRTFKKGESSYTPTKE